jgi:hypothetical protein
MALVADARLIERRLETTRARRAAAEAPAGTRAPLPDWAADTLVMLGMTRDEIARAEAETAAAPVADPGDAEDDSADAAVEALEDALLARAGESLDAVHALAEIALARLKRSAPVDPNDVFYDAGEARAVALFEQVVAGLERLRGEEWRRTG